MSTPNILAIFKILLDVVTICNIDKVVPITSNNGKKNVSKANTKKTANRILIFLYCCSIFILLYIIEFFLYN